jgi:hypothetical protein
LCKKYIKDVAAFAVRFRLYQRKEIKSNHGLLQKVGGTNEIHRNDGADALRWYRKRFRARKARKDDLLGNSCEQRHQFATTQFKHG